MGGINMPQRGYVWVWMGAVPAVGANKVGEDKGGERSGGGLTTKLGVVPPIPPQPSSPPLPPPLGLSLSGRAHTDPPVAGPAPSGRGPAPCLAERHPVPVAVARPRAAPQRRRVLRVRGP